MHKAKQPIPLITGASLHARLRSIPLTDVKLDDHFWAPRRRINRQVTLASQYQHCQATGRIANFERAAGKLDTPFQGMYFDDSDVYKWLEAVAWTLATDPDPALVEMADTVISAIADVQEADGYLNTYFTFEQAAERWSNLRDMHELYCAGHLIQAAIAHYRATTSQRLLTVACRLADHICATFGEKRPGASGHPEIEMALVELTRTIGESKYAAQACRFLAGRGQGLIGGREYHQDHQPFLQLERMAGHAVRAVYLNAGAADLYAETGEPVLRETLERLWRNMTSRQMYVSGGIGARYLGEAFGGDYQLPNARAYAESCAAIGVIMWAWRMLALQGQAEYADVMELTLYNGFLVGVSLDGQGYFYQNPLSNDGSHRRQPWFGCACCPPNIARMLASLPGYFYSLSAEGVWLHLYAEGSADLLSPDGRPLRLTQHTRYPWDGEVNIKVDGEGHWSLMLRIPGWCEQGATLEVNGRPANLTLTPGTYVRLERDWQPGDSIHLNLPMPVRRVACHPSVTENAGRAALMRGPLLYCVEEADNPCLDPRDLLLPAEAAFSTSWQPDLLGGVITLHSQAQVAPPDEVWSTRLYHTVRPQPAAGRAIALTAIPYYAWANRESGPMQVWLKTLW